MTLNLWEKPLYEEPDDWFTLLRRQEQLVRLLQRFGL
jgi:hypothetical protein